jgi:hypothetical protein
MARDCRPLCVKDGSRIWNDLLRASAMQAGFEVPELPLPQLGLQQRPAEKPCVPREQFIGERQTIRLLALISIRVNLDVGRRQDERKVADLSRSR